MSTLVQEFRWHLAEYGFKWAESQDVRSSNPKLLFNISGGVPYEAILAGEASPAASRRIASCQRCVRTDNLEGIGRSGRHHIAFDMLGHFIFDEMPELPTKQLAITSAWTFLTEVVQLPRERLFATVHPADAVAHEVWRALGVSVVYASENTDINPRQTRCGLRSEIVWRQRDGRNVELWNLVFMQFQGTRLFGTPLDTIAFDSGVSLDRVQAAAEDCVSNYSSSLWKPMVDYLAKACPSADLSVLCRLADFLRSAIWIAESGITPGNRAESYVLRKLIRQAYLLALGEGLSLEELLVAAIHYWQPHLLIQPLSEEVARYAITLQRGEHEAHKLLRRRGGQLSDADIAWLAETYGYPPELTLVLLSSRGE